MAVFDADYFDARALAELKMAAKATSPAAAEVHRDLAKRYRKRVDQSKPAVLPQGEEPYPDTI